MPIEVYLGEEFEYKHEREFFNDLIQSVQNDWKNPNDLIILIGNVSCQGNKIDALLLKQGVICLLEFKNYGGELFFSENANWTVDGKIINAAKFKNPYLQSAAYRNDLIRFLENNQEKILLNNSQVSWRHIYATVTFHQPVKFDKKTIPPSIRSWFDVADNNSLTQTLSNFYSNKLVLSEAELNRIPQILGVSKFQSLSIQRSSTISRTVSEEIIQEIKATFDEVNKNEFCVYAGLTNDTEEIIKLKCGLPGKWFYYSSDDINRLIALKRYLIGTEKFIENRYEEVAANNKKTISLFIYPLKRISAVKIFKYIFLKFILWGILITFFVWMNVYYLIKAGHIEDIHELFGNTISISLLTFFIFIKLWITVLALYSGAFIYMLIMEKHIKKRGYDPLMLKWFIPLIKFDFCSLSYRKVARH